MGKPASAKLLEEGSQIGRFAGLDSIIHGTEFERLSPVRIVGGEVSTTTGMSLSFGRVCNQANTPETSIRGIFKSSRSVGSFRKAVGSSSN